MSKSKKPVEDTRDEDVFDHVTFSILQLPIDNLDARIPTQRILQTVTRDGVTKRYVTESPYFRGEMFQFLASFIQQSFDGSIMKQQSTLAPVRGGRYWVHLNDDTIDGKKQPRVDPESFE